MKKSDIVIAVVVCRSEKSPTEKQILKDLSSVLNNLSLNSETWDEDIETVIANGIIKHVGSVKGELSLQDIVLDIDMLLKRIS